jgi:alpha-beta hydrolase superfamily lysophospholipase
MLVAAIEAEHPGLRIVIAGHSLGTVVAIHAAALRAEAGSPIHAVTAWGPYDRVRTPFEARLRLRGLPVRPFSDAILRLWSALDGPERPTTASAALLRDTTLGIHADTQDPVSPMEDAERISSACAGSTVVRTVGVAHADLGT